MQGNVCGLLVIVLYNRLGRNQSPKFYSEPGFIRTLKSDVSFLLPTFTFVSATARTNKFENCLGCDGRQTTATRWIDLPLGHTISTFSWHGPWAEFGHPGSLTKPVLVGYLRHDDPNLAAAETGPCANILGTQQANSHVHRWSGVREKVIQTF